MHSHDPRLELALAHHQSGRLAQAEAVYRQLLAEQPRNAPVLHLLGALAHQTGHHQAAIQLIQQATAIDDREPDWFNNLGEALRMLGRHAEAIDAYQAALRLDPAFPEAHNNLGTVLQNEGHLAEALACYDRAVALRPDYANARYNRARTWLSMGDFERGWAEYEWRWQRAEFLRPPRVAPEWNGEPLAGRRLLISAEQGLGDTLQFVRYARQFAAHEQVFVEVAPPLIPLLSQSGFGNLIGEGGALPPVDFQISMLSLPRVRGTTLATIPCDVPYLAGDASRIHAWRTRLAGLSGLKVGIHWHGNPRSPLEPWRSPPLAEFAPLASIGDVRLVSLQKGHGTEQIAHVAPRFAVHELGANFDTSGGAFMDTAAVIAAVDLVITSDSAVAHLAGAMGAPVWVLLPVSADWRWLRDRADSPWYPTMRLYRQTKLGQWRDVFDRVAANLAAERHDLIPRRHHA